jgi:hypothetical protein
MVSGFSIDYSFRNWSDVVMGCTTGFSPPEQMRISYSRETSNLSTP